MKCNKASLLVILVALTLWVQAKEEESTYDVIKARPQRNYPAESPSFVGHGRTRADYAIQENDIQLMRLLGVSRQPHKLPQDVAEEKRKAIEESAKEVPLKKDIRVLSPREKVDLKGSKTLAPTNAYVAPEYTTLVKAP